MPRFWCLCFAVGVCLWSEFCFAAPSDEAKDTCQSGFSFKTGTEEQYVVRFHQYRPASDWRRALERAMGDAPSRWTWIERNNAAAPYPTDFGVLRFPDGAAKAMKVSLGQRTVVGDGLFDQERLETLRFVKDVHPDRLLRQDLLFASEKRLPGNPGKVHKPPGRFRTRPTFGLDSQDDEYTYEADEIVDELRRKLLSSRPHSVTHMLRANDIWEMGFAGENVRVGVFDTGIRANHPHIRKIKERTNWTHQNTLSDGLGHGTFVAGVIAGSYDGCLGFAPDVDLYTFKVFTDDQVSYTSWFLDAFNYAIITKMHVVNLSIGGPDYLDHPFVEKVPTASNLRGVDGICVGNDGPLYGTLNNPADQNDVIGIGGINYEDGLARFSSRGMSTWELPLGYGRIKPDVLAYAQDVSGSKMQNGCRSLSGTSVASPVAAGAVALLASTVLADRRWDLLNPASMKQALVEGAHPIAKAEIYVQGAGKINLVDSMKILANYEPRASLIPGKLDLTDCPYMWPFCKQPLYASAVPIIINGTIMNGMGVAGTLREAPVFVPSNDAGRLISMDFEYSDVLWPWSGYLAIYARVVSEGTTFSGIAEGDIEFTVTSPPAKGETAERVSHVAVPFKAQIIPTPPRENRLLWDQFHSVKYPPAYFPRDNLENQRDILDWHGDHLHTNFHLMFDHLVAQGYYVEILGSPLTCFNATQYGALIIADSEDVFYPEEVEKLDEDVREHGLGLIVVAEWYNAETAKGFKFFDDNTRSWWTPATGGCNIPGLNALLDPFGIAFGDRVLRGEQTITDDLSVRVSSGSNIIRFPVGGYLHSSRLEDVSEDRRAEGEQEFATLGLTSHGEGRVAVYGDSDCLDSSYHGSHCFELLDAMLSFVRPEKSDDLMLKLTDESYRVLSAVEAEQLPKPIDNFNFTEVSFVLTHPLQCYLNRPGIGENREAEEGHDEAPSAIHARVQAEAREEVAQQRVVKEPDEPNEVHRAHLDIQNVAATNGIPDPDVFDPPQKIPDWTPPLIMSKWSALFGIVIMIGLYRISRRRRQSTHSSGG